MTKTTTLPTPATPTPPAINSTTGAMIASMVGTATPSPAITDTKPTAAAMSVPITAVRARQRRQRKQKPPPILLTEADVLQHRKQQQQITRQRKAAQRQYRQQRNPTNVIVTTPSLLAAASSDALAAVVNTANTDDKYRATRQQHQQTAPTMTMTAGSQPLRTITTPAITTTAAIDSTRAHNDRHQRQNIDTATAAEEKSNIHFTATPTLTTTSTSPAAATTPTSTDSNHTHRPTRQVAITDNSHHRDVRHHQLMILLRHAREQHHRQQRFHRNWRRLSRLFRQQPQSRFRQQQHYYFHRSFSYFSRHTVAALPSTPPDSPFQVPNLRTSITLTPLPRQAPRTTQQTVPQSHHLSFDIAPLPTLALRLCPRKHSRWRHTQQRSTVYPRKHGRWRLSCEYFGSTPLFPWSGFLPAISRYKPLCIKHRWSPPPISRYKLLPSSLT